MTFLDLPIKRKVMALNLLTSASALLLSVAAFTAYDFFAYRRTMARDLSTVAAIIADNSTAALAFPDRTVAQEILGAFRADPHVVGAGLYDNGGNLFVRYPPSQP